MNNLYLFDKIFGTNLFLKDEDIYEFINTIVDLKERGIIWGGKPMPTLNVSFQNK